MGNEHVSIGSHHFGEDLAPQVERFFSLDFILLDILETGAVDGNKELPES